MENFLPIPKHPYWENISNESWANWTWQQQNRVRTLAELSQLIELSEEEVNAFLRSEQKFKVAITPYYISLMDRKNPLCPIRRQAIPSMGELTTLTGERLDSQQEESMSPVPGIVHRYPDRVLLYTTHHCAVYCRFCTRKRKVSDPASAPLVDDIDTGIKYIKETPSIREVIVSGGDALSNSNDRLAMILDKLRSIRHVEIIRIGSRNLVTLPYRVNEELVKILADHAPIYFHTHFNHPLECTREALDACALLADRGIVLNNHTVLLRGINDNAKIMADLNKKLLMMRVRPYYLYQCDLVEGNGAFRTSIRTGLDIIRSLRGWTSGLAVPHYMVDTPGGGKVPLLPDYVESEENGVWTFRNYRGELFQYDENATSAHTE